MSVKVVVGLDKLVVGLPFPKMPKGAELAKLSVQEKQEILEKGKQYIAHGKHIVNMVKLGDNYFVQNTKQPGLKRYCVKSGKTDAPVFSVYFGCINKTWVINFEWNPSKMSEDDKDEFLAALEGGMLDGHYGELFQRGVVSHAEFHIDVYGADISKLVMLDNRKSSNQLVESTTTYSGKRGAALVLSMYDKAKQLGEAEMRVRIEARLKRRDMTLQKFIEYIDSISNPFGNLIIIDVIQLQSASHELQMPQLAGQLKELGVYGAVKNKHARQKIVAHLQKKMVEWWKPAEHWEHHKELLQGLIPKNYDKQHWPVM